MNKVLKMLQKNWILVWLIVSAVFAVSFIAYAEYIEKYNHVKKVVANTADSNQRFASDYLSTDAPSSREIGVSAIDGQTTYEIPIKIWNYDPSNSAKFYSSLLNYDLYAQLVDQDGELINTSTFTSKSFAGNIGIRKESDADPTLFSTAVYNSTDGYKLTLSNSFAGTAKDDHVYYLSFPSTMLSNNGGIYVLLTAQPSANNNDLAPLYGIFTVTASTAELKAGWSGDINDDTTQPVTNYDGFNYVISGNGTASVTFCWQPEYLEVNSLFLSNNSLTTETFYKDSEGNSTYTVTVEVDGVPTEQKVEYESLPTGGTTWKRFRKDVNSNVVSRYDIQLYMTSDDLSDYNTWNKVKNYIDFDSSSS